RRGHGAARGDRHAPPARPRGGARAPPRGRAALDDPAAAAADGGALSLAELLDALADARAM
ncbi:MAG: hypothetical protein AVDCRST_MAG18-633, partial [uncultured Thermomicrobiales bacterium]